MDFKNDDEDEDTATCSSFEKLKKSEDQQDLLSGLPDEILLHILSFLPIEDAVKTVLLRRFGNLWRGIRILDFDQCLSHSCYNGPYCNQKLMNLIHQVVKFNESRTLEKLSLKFAFHKGYDSILEDQGLKSTPNEIDSLVHFAVRKKVKVLDLDLLGCGFIELVEEYSVPDIVFRNDHLMELRLASCDIELPGEISLKSLKILSLKDIELSNKLVEKILLGCPSLEDLTLIGCSCLTNLNCSNNPNLKKLNLFLHLGKDLTISWNAALSVEIPKCLEGGAKLLNLPSAIDASLFIGSRFRWERKEHNEVKRQPQKFSLCRTCAPSSSCILNYDTISKEAIAAFKAYQASSSALDNTSAKIDKMYEDLKKAKVLPLTSYEHLPIIKKVLEEKSGWKGTIQVIVTNYSQGVQLKRASQNDMRNAEVVIKLVDEAL